MGRQTQLHMLPADVLALLEFVQSHDPVVVTLRSSDTAQVKSVPEPHVEPGVMILWNKNLISALERKLIRRMGGNDYYRVDDFVPALEFSPSRPIVWDGTPALLQGRIYGVFDKASTCEDWYEKIALWIRDNFTKNPLTLLGGYIGPAALAWFQNGGVLLPMIEPPRTSEWVAFVGSQHVAPSTASSGRATAS